MTTVMQRRTRRNVSNAVKLVFVFGASLIVLAPFIWMVSLAFTPADQAFGSVSLIPAEPTLDNFVTALTEANMLQALLNSAVVAGIVVVGNCLFAVLAGYAFAMLPFRGSTTVFYAILATTAIPASVTLIPQFLMVKSFPLTGGNDLIGQGGTGLLDSIAGLALPSLVGAMNVFLARQYFMSSSPDLAEAARIDGASEWLIFRRIYVPLAKPLLAVVAIFSFVGVWDDFLWPLVITTSRSSQTVQLALAQFLSSGNIQYGPLMAGAVLITVPVLIVFIFNQRGFISGLSDGSVKG